MGFLLGRRHVVIALFAFLFCRKLGVSSLEPGDGVVVFIFAIEGKASLVQSFSSILTLREALDDVEEPPAGVGPMAILQVNAGAAEPLKFIGPGLGLLVEPIQAERALESIVVSRALDQTGEDLASGGGVPSLHVSLAEQSHGSAARDA